MLSRPATKISLTPDDILAYEQRRAAREAAKTQDLASSQASQTGNVENGTASKNESQAAATQTRAARVKMSREQRIGVGGSRG